MAHPRFGVVVFPGSNCDMDAYHALKEVMNQQVDYVWYQERSIDKYDCVVLPGGFSYGDYLRGGAIARFAPVMDAVVTAAHRGKLILGICNGFQILCESGLLPGTLQRNGHLQFQCSWTHMRVENNHSPFTHVCNQGDVLKIPVAHGEGNYFADPETLAQLNTYSQVLFRYCTAAGDVTPAASPNGSVENIAGIMNRQGNVMGLMPHPERASEAALGSADGQQIFLSLIRYLANERVAQLA